MSAKRSGVPSRSPLPVSPTVRPLGDADLALVVLALNDIAPLWSVELQGLSADDTTLVLLPEDGDDENGPSFVISREPGGFHLDQVHWDVFTEVGVFGSMHDVISALCVRLAFCGAVVVPPAVTLH